ncbi:MAG: DUF2189 domain-containing protein [Hyphomicrobiaceae bacterium]
MSTTIAQASETEIVEGIAIRAVSLDAPWDWLRAGWADLWTHPHVSLAYGAVFALLAVLMFIGMSHAGMQSIILALAGGFMLVGPAIAVGLYDVSRRIEKEEPVSFADIFQVGAKAQGQLGFLGAILAFFYFVWLQMALLLFMLFFGGSSTFPPASKFMNTLLFEPHGLALLIIGTLIGAALAVIAFSISVVSVPLLLTRRIDAITAIYVSVETVVKNLRPMALWAALIAVITAGGLITSFVGLIVAFPLLGHASWHAFRDLIVFRDNH